MKKKNESFWDDVLSVISDLSETGAVVLAGDLNGHIGASADGYEGVHGGFGYGRRNLEGEYCTYWKPVLHSTWLCATPSSRRG